MWRQGVYDRSASPSGSPGERDEQTVTYSRGPSGGRTTSTSMRRMPVLPVDAIRNFSFGTGIVLHRTARPVVTSLTRGGAAGTAAKWRGRYNSCMGWLA